ncbi:MAG: motility associated factor glycosyltransferase family protein [Syntrophomonadaceae bacterium]|nr:motility associated factor glycosyltransferase family protein [Syntrophomonadaceae bacterium]
MILVDNIVFMKDNFPSIWETYRDREDMLNADLVTVESSKVKGYPSLAINKDEKTYYIHSRYNPEREVATIIDNFNGEEYEHVIFYGIGLGYHIEAFLERYPHLTFSFYEPIPEVFRAYLSNSKLKDLPVQGLNEIVVENSPIDANNFLNKIVKKYKKILYFDLPSYKSIFPNKHSRFAKLFTEIARGQLSSLATNLTFEKRWIINCLLNFRELLDTPNIIMEKAGQFKNLPAIIVAAGPSLDYEIENLKQIKENGLAYIFSVGSAVNSLIDAGIYPDAQCAIDPGEANQQYVFARITEERIVDIPLIFGSSIGHEVLANYPGQNKLHMITSQDTISSYLLKVNDGRKLDGVMDAPSVAVVTLQMLYILGFNPIILVGQNLAYKDNRHYADGIEYADSMRIDSSKTESLMRIRDVEGNEVYASIPFERMRLVMEEYIKLMPDTQVINTTRGGAHIEGTEFRHLEELIHTKVLGNTIVDKEWYKLSPTEYDLEYINKQFKKLYKDYQVLAEALLSVLEVLNEISALKEAKNIKQLDKSWGKLDKAFKKVQNNRFFDKAIRPMNRVAFELLLAKLPDIRFESDLLRKAELITESFTGVILACITDLQMVQEEMEEMGELLNA